MGTIFLTWNRIAKGKSYHTKIHQKNYYNRYHHHNRAVLDLDLPRFTSICVVVVYVFRPDHILEALDYLQYLFLIPVGMKTSP